MQGESDIRRPIRRRSQRGGIPVTTEAASAVKPPAAVSASGRRHKWLRRIAIGVPALIALFAVLGFLVVPPVAKRAIERLASEELERAVTLESVSFNPFTLVARVRKLAIADRYGPQPLLAIDEVMANLSAKSLLHLAPVVQSLRVSHPVASLIRLDESRYNVTEIIEKQLRKPKPPEDKPAKFALYNVELTDGHIDFDDRPEKLKHRVTALHIAVPFISSFPADIDVNVQPALEAMINDDPLKLGGVTKPFKDTLETALDVDFTDIDLPRYLAYLPVDLALRLPSGKLDTRLHVVFATKGGKPATLTVAGTAALREIAVQHRGGQPAVAFKSLAVDLEQADLFARTVAVKQVRLEAPDLRVALRKDGTSDLADLLRPGAAASTPQAAPQKPAAPPAKSVPAAAAPDAKPFMWRVAEIAVTGGRVDFTDQGPAQPFHTVVSPIDITVKGLANAADAKAEIVAALGSDFTGRLEHTGTFSLSPLALGGHVGVSGIRIAKLQPYLAAAVDGQIEGTLGLATDYAVWKPGGELAPRLDRLAITLEQGRVSARGVKEPLWRIPKLEVRDAMVDVAGRQVAIGETTLSNAVAYVMRNADGTTSYDRLVRSAPAAAAPAAPAPRATAEPARAPPRKGDASPGWSVVVKKAAALNAAVTFDDRGPSPEVATRLTRLNVTAENVATAPGSEARLSVRGALNRSGTFDATGRVVMSPLKGRLELKTRNLDLAPYQPYIEPFASIAVNSGAVSNAGTLSFDATPGRPLQLGYRGSMDVTDLATVNTVTVQDLVNWKSLHLGGVDFSLEPFKADIEEIALGDFYARIILNADGTLDLQHLRGKAVAAPEVVAMPKDTPAAPVPAPAPTGIEAAAQAAAAHALPPNVRLGKLSFYNGNVNFSDFFIKPNYTANLTNLNGGVTEMTPDKPGDVEIRARLDNAAPVEIDGRVNALAKDLFLDLKASAKGIDLPPLSPYSAKYAGYGIEKGKLSVTVKYLVANRKLAAENNLYLDQLTFGEKVDSPTATKLPVLLAVALLKDRNGVIDINLPISGSLDDPQFSVGGLIIRVIVNLLTKAITAPFALIGAAFADGPELSYIEFDPGTPMLNEGAIKRLQVLAKALESRPGVKLDIAGRVDPPVDRESLRERAIERKVKAEKYKELSRSGKAPASVEDTLVDPKEYETYLRRAYRNEDFPKPRNVFGFVKDIPVPEMRTLMLTHTQVTDEDLRVLANQRAQAAKSYLVDVGKIPPERVFLVAPKLNAEGVKEGKPTRAEFSLK